MAAADPDTVHVRQAAPLQRSAFIEQVSPAAQPQPGRTARRPARKTAPQKAAAKSPSTTILEVRITDLGAFADGMPLTLPSVRDGVSHRFIPNKQR